MKISISPKITKTDAIFILLPEKNWQKQFESNLEKNLATQIALHFKNKNFKGKLGEILQIFPSYKLAKKIFLVGAGELKEKIDIRKTASLAIREAKKIKTGNVALLCPKDFDVERVVSGILLGDYEFKIGDRSEQFTPKSATIISSQKISKKELDSEIALSEATNFVRELTNLPPNMMTPKILATSAKKEIKTSPKMKVKVMGEKEIQKLKMGNLFGVGQGSHEESQLIVFEYSGGKKGEKPLAIVGKGVCFDAGGYNLKPTNHIEDMKCDMAGAATVLGIFKWISEVQPKKNIVGVVGAVENLVSGNAFKPGDILTSMNGKTMEITNTDAEGRLVLADCLYYAATKLKPAQMIDLATLTGACIAALGHEITAIMGNNKKLLDSIEKAAKGADEPVWELPITDHFREKVKGDISDLKNWTAGVSAGSSMGGAFLEYFVEKIPWAHLDIAGTAFHGKAGDELSPKGGTGVMIRTLAGMIGK